MNSKNLPFIFPMFTGASELVHWHLCVMQQLPCCIIGWTIDSLNVNKNGRQQYTENVFDESKISPCKDIQWNHVPCFTQVELECGPQTLLHMKYLLESFRKINSCMEKTMLDFETCQNIHRDTSKISIFSRQTLQSMITTTNFIITPVVNKRPIKKRSINNPVFLNEIIPVVNKRPVKNFPINNPVVLKDITNLKKIRRKNKSIV